MAAEGNNPISWSVTPDCIRNMMGEPAYVLIVHSSDPSCGRGDNYKVEVYISGAGDVDQFKKVSLAKLYVSVPAYIPKTLEILEKGPNEIIRLSVEAKYLEYTSIEPSRNPNTSMEPNFKAKLNKTRHTNAFDITLPHYLFGKKFFNTDPKDLGVEGERIIWDKEYWKEDYYAPPLSFNFNVAGNAPPGDHNIYLHLVYKSCSKWYSSSAILKIHIKQWYEEDTIRALVISAAIGSIISGCYALYNLLFTTTP
jgi:hypothetical protein